MRNPSGAEDTGSEDAGVEVRAGVGSGNVAVGIGGVKVGVISTIAVGAGIATPQAAS